MSKEILGDGGDRLLNEFEPGPGGKPALVAYRCPGGRWTLGNGATVWPNGDEVRPGDTCTPEQADEITDWSVKKFADVVDGFITRPMTANQRDAFILLAYNIGPTAFRTDCAASAMFNDGHSPLKVAPAFGNWHKATSSGPEKSDLRKSLTSDIIGVKASIAVPDSIDDYVWLGPADNPPKGYDVVRDGPQFFAIKGEDRIPLGIRPVKYQRAFPGLLRRHLAEAHLFLDLDWSFTCVKDRVSINSYRVWDSNDRRWEDRVRSKTELADLLPDASKHPLRLSGEMVLFNPLPIVIEPTPLPVGEVDLDDIFEAPATDPDVAVAGQAARLPSPSPPVPATQVPAPKSTSPASVVPSPAVAEKQASTVAPASSPAAPVGTKPLSPSTVSPAQVPYRINADAGLKPLDESERAKGYWYQQAGIGIIRLGTLGVFGTGAQKASAALQGDPALSNIALTLFVIGGIFVTGYVVKVYGDWKRKRGEKAATQALY